MGLLNFRSNQKLLVCAACGKSHAIEKGVTECSFICDGCKNEIYIDENGNQTVLGTLEAPVSSENLDPDPELEEEKNDKENNKFSLMG